jgi:transcriptional regulator GlxA family with amidase domain
MCVRRRLACTEWLSARLRLNWSTHVLGCWIFLMLRRIFHSSANSFNARSYIACCRETQGQRLRATATLGDQSNRTAKAVAWLRANYSKPLRVEQLATVAGMSRSTLHHHFRALTAMSPLQFQKQLRLRAARQQMLTNDLDAASAAFEVGYESASQFNREYRRFFGRPPIRDIKALRDSKVVAITAA